VRSPTSRGPSGPVLLLETTPISRIVRARPMRTLPLPTRRSCRVRFSFALSDLSTEFPMRSSLSLLLLDLTSNNRCILARQLQRRLYRTLNSAQALAGSSSSTTSLVTKRFHWIEPRREVGRDQSRERTDQKCTDTDDSDVVRNDFGRDRRELINLARENLDV